MWWKIYFGITIIEAFLNILSIFMDPGIHIANQIILMVLFLIAVFGLYGYIYQKKFLSPVFWQYFLGIYVLIDVIYLIYSAAPAAPFISFLSFLTIYKPNNYTFISALFGVAIDIPLMYVLYRLGKDELYVPKLKKKSDKPYKWGMPQIALWGYSSVLTFFLFILALVPSTSSTATKGSMDLYSLTFIAVVFAPMLIFWLWVVVMFRSYRWNWWRTTLVANALLYSGLLVFGSLLSQSPQESSGFDVISVLQLFILLVSLYVFGKEQFK